MTEQNNERREIPIRDENDAPGPADDGEKTPAAPPRDGAVIPESAAASAYAKQAGGEQPQKPPSEQGASETQPDESAAAVNAAERALEELTDKHLRLRAEFDNFRKRVERERVEIIKRASADLMADLLPVLDHFRLALDADSDKGDSFRTGVEMIDKQLRDVLGRHGLERIKAEGQHFDPQIHEALMTEPSNEHEEGEVIEILQEGYTLRGAVLRPARVKVAVAPNPTTGEDD